MEPIFKPLYKEEFRRRIGDSFPAVYLTLISIIQGVALGILASNTFSYIKDPHLAESWTRFLPYSVMSFISIIVVSYEYTWFIGIFRWSPEIWDTIIPFALGASEVGPMFYLTDPQSWWLLTSVFCYVGAGALFYTLWNCKQSIFGTNEAAYRRTKNTLKWDILIVLVAALNCTLAWILLSREIWYLEILFFVFSIGCAVVIICIGEKFTNGLHRDFGLTR
ncbi:MAG: hypothetical protein DRH12_16665 [Deltaproteobacteria bacterium]|nr:MAG: hypothetical protein DRH12_16665 [Deltaproteobacteria bacterium]